MSEQNRILISYFPFLEGIAGQQYSLTDKKQIDEILKDSQTPNVVGVAWVHYPFDRQEIVVPVLLIERAKELADHLVYWAENEVDRRFDLFIDERPEGYAIALVPNIDESIRRYKLARLVMHEELVQGNNFYVLFGVLGTVCKGGTYKDVKNKVQKRTYIGFMNPDGLDKGYDSITIVGPVGLKNAADSSVAKQYCDERFKDMGNDKSE